MGRLLYFARPISLNLQTLDVGELCATVVQAWKARAPASTTFSCDTPLGLITVADRSRLLQVLDNLIENAVQASKASASEVQVQATRQDDSVRIDVLDNGIGFDPTALDHAFDPFFTTKETGTGLGLSIAFELVQAHGGELKAASRSGGGAVVSIILPQTNRDQEMTS